MSHPIFSHIDYGSMDWNGCYEKSTLHEKSPFVGRSVLFDGKEVTKKSSVYEWMQDIGTFHETLNCMCEYLGVAADGDIIDKWIRVSTVQPLLSHLIPIEYCEDDRIKNFCRMLHVGGIQWETDDVLATTRTALIGLDYERMEVRSVVRNEYDDNNYNQVESLSPFLMKNGERMGFGGHEVTSQESIYRSDESLWTLFNRGTTLFSSIKSLSEKNLSSFVYSIRHDRVYVRDIAVGMSIGRE